MGVFPDFIKRAARLYTARLLSLSLRWTVFG